MNAPRDAESLLNTHRNATHRPKIRLLDVNQLAFKQSNINLPFPQFVPNRICSFQEISNQIQECQSRQHNMFIKTICHDFQPFSEKANKQAHAAIIKHMIDSLKQRNKLKQTQLRTAVGLQVRKVNFSQRKNQKNQVNSSPQKQVCVIIDQEPSREVFCRIGKICNRTQQNLREQKKTLENVALNLRRHKISTVQCRKTKYSDRSIQKIDNSNVFKFGNVVQGSHKIYQAKMRSFRQFILLMHFALGITQDLRLLSDCKQARHPPKLKAYVGKGNNSNLIKSLIKRRFWWQIVSDMQQADLVWTQLKVNSVFSKQNAAQVFQQENSKQKTSNQNMFPKQRRSFIAKKIQKHLELSKKLMLNATGVRKVLSQNEAKIFTQQQFEQKSLNDRLKKLSQNKQLSLPRKGLISNHFPKNFYLGNKKALFYTLKLYYERKKIDPFRVIPLTFHIRNGTQDREYKKFLAHFRKREKISQESQDQPSKRNIWIVKPGQNSNRGQGITVIDQLYQLTRILNSKDKGPDGKQKTYIVQNYINQPLLYNNRKFDLRHYVLISFLCGKFRAYWSFDGYVRTSSKEFSTQYIDDPMVHLTNDAIQKDSYQYGRYEPANKLSYKQLQRYIDSKYKKRGWNFFTHIYPRMRDIARDCILANKTRLNPGKLEHNFQIFGLDFMIDSDFKPWLIEVNTNPCLQLPCPLLQQIIPTMVQHSLRLTIDILHPPPSHYPNTSKHLTPDQPLQKLRMQLLVQGQQKEQEQQRGLTVGQQQLQEQQQQYEDEGSELKEQLMV